MNRASMIAIVLACIFSSEALAADNDLTAEEKADGYILLFNGKELQGWRRAASGVGSWRVEDGTISRPRTSGTLFTEAEYDNFVLKLDFKMSKGCNSGVFFRVGDPRNEVYTGFEVQILDDPRKRPERNSCGAVYDLVAPTKLTAKPAGEWNTMTISANRSLLSVDLNGTRVCEMNVDEWDKLGLRPDGSRHKFHKAIKEFPRKGFIGLQDHGTQVWFKNIKLKVLNRS